MHCTYNCSALQWEEYGTIAVIIHLYCNLTSWLAINSIRPSHTGSGLIEMSQFSKLAAVNITVESSRSDHSNAIPYPLPSWRELCSTWALLTLEQKAILFENDHWYVWEFIYGMDDITPSNLASNPPYLAKVQLYGSINLLLCGFQAYTNLNELV